MRNYSTRIGAGLSLFLLFTFPLKAAFYTYNATIDISTPYFISHPTGQWDYLWIISGAPTFNVHPSDTVQGTITFAGNERMQFLGPVSAATIELTWMDFANTTPNTSVNVTTLNGVSGSLTWPNPSGGSSSTPGAQLIAALGEIWTPDAVSFTGFTYSATMGTGSGNYTPYYLTAYTPNDVPAAISVIPEPSVVSLFGVGLIMLLARHFNAANR